MLIEKIMATVSAKVYEHHKNERKFIDTTHYVVKKQLTKDYKIKDLTLSDCRFKFFILSRRWDFPVNTVGLTDKTL